MYQVGEYIIYRNVGICKVEAIGKLCFSAEEKDYYTLRPLYASGNARLYVPVNKDMFMRNVITRQEAYEYLNVLEEMQTQPFGAKKTVQLAAHYDDLMTRHDLASHLRLFKELCQKEKMVREKGKKFGQLESRYMSQVEKLLADEFSYALSETPDLSKKRLHAAI